VISDTHRIKKECHEVRRCGLTVIELMIAIVILSLMLGLTLSGVLKIRNYSLRMQSSNKLRQISLALQNHICQSNGRLIAVANVKGYNTEVDRPILYDLTPYLGGEPQNWDSAFGPDYYENVIHWRQCFIGPADPTIKDFLRAKPQYYNTFHPTSYCHNMTASVGFPALATHFPDGTSTTIAMAERFATLSDRKSEGRVQYDFTAMHSEEAGGRGNRRASFADRGYNDIYPVTTDSPPQSVSSRDGITFVTKPDPFSADDGVLQSPYSEGLLVSFFDGSVRLLRRGTHESVFWGLVTRDGGESVNTD